MYPRPSPFSLTDQSIAQAVASTISFVAPLVPGNYQVFVRARDVDQTTGSTATIYAYPSELLVINYSVAAQANLAPQADAGTDQSIHAGVTVQLTGTASSDDNTATASLGYAWNFASRPAGSTATLSGATTATPNFVADMVGAYTVELIVTDEAGLQSAADSVTISSNNLAPTANAGTGQMVVVFSTVSLNGSGSTDPDGDPLSYAWTISSRPDGSTTVLSGPTTATPNFQPDQPGAYTLTLTVSDFLGAGAPATVEVTAITAGAYAEQKIMCAADLIAGLGPNQVTTKGNQNALGNFLSQTVKEMQKGNNANAISKVNEAIERTNGCEVNPGPSPDGNGPGRDWVTDCGVQPPILACLREVQRVLAP
jgi:hypothetical protein